MTRRRWFLTVVLAALAALLSGGAWAQSGVGAQQNVSPSRYPPALPKRVGPAPPPLAFRLLATIPLPGKLSGESPSLDAGRIRVPLENGTAIVDLNSGPPTVATLEPAAPGGGGAEAPAGASRWIEDASGKRRFRTTVEGVVEAEHHRKHSATGWRKEWHAHLPGAAVSEPLVALGRVVVGAMDARVHCLRMENGHRLWATDVGERIRRPVVLWTGRIPGEKGRGDLPVSLILVLGQEGGILSGLDPYDGRRIATFELHPSEGRFASSAVAVSDGTIAVARETYAKPEGELLLLAVERAPEQAKPGSKDPYGKVPASRPGP